MNDWMNYSQLHPASLDLEINTELYYKQPIIFPVDQRLHMLSLNHNK